MKASVEKWLSYKKVYSKVNKCEPFSDNFPKHLKPDGGRGGYEKMIGDVQSAYGDYHFFVSNEEIRWFQVFRLEGIFATSHLKVQMWPRRLARIS